MRRVILAVAFMVPFFLSCGIAPAAQDHAQRISGPFKTGQDVTRTCLQCHESHAKDFMKTVHWTWSSVQEIQGRGKVDLGKKNAINNYCIALPSNNPRCTSCHAGYGWKDASFDFNKAENVDCLVCHDTTGTYKKLPAASGNPAYQDTEFPPKSGNIWKAVDLEKVAKSVGPTSRANCGACHFFGGGGDHVKHGDLDSSMAAPKRTMDVHMAVDGANMTCSACHRAEKHVIPGKSMGVSVAGGGQTMDCKDCHAGSPHGANAQLNKHAQKVACQTCHIPTSARTLPTKVWWDWSTAGKDGPAAKDQYGLPLYDKQKGDFKWAKDVKPTYMWFNGAGFIVEYQVSKTNPDKADPESARVVASHVAPPWREVLRPLNKHSDNAHTRLLYLLLGVHSKIASSADATTFERADREIRDWLQSQKIASEGLVLDNGSGLSRAERITPRTLALMLKKAHESRYAPDLLMSLPVAGEDGSMRNRLKNSAATGWARLKTGSLRNVAALAGIVYDPRRRPLVVVAMINHDDARKARPALDALVEWVARGRPMF